MPVELEVLVCFRTRHQSHRRVYARTPDVLQGVFEQDWDTSMMNTYDSVTNFQKVRNIPAEPTCGLLILCTIIL